MVEKKRGKPSRFAEENKDLEPEELKEEKPKKIDGRKNNRFHKGNPKTGRKTLVEQVKESQLKMQEARPTVLPDVEEELLKYIAMGLSVGDACDLVKIDRGAFYDWQQRGRKEKAEGIKSIYVAFLHNLKQAELTAKAFHLQNINKHAKGGFKLIKHKVRKDKSGNIIEEETFSDEIKGSWQASSWFLARKYPDEFSENKKVGNEEHKVLPWSDNPANDIADPLANKEVCEQVE